MWTMTAQGLGRWLGHRLALSCLLSLLLLIAHQALMSSERHTMAMAVLSEWLAPASQTVLVAGLSPAHESDGQPMPQAPETVMSDCLNQQAIFPLLLLILVLSGILAELGSPLQSMTGLHAWMHGILAPYPPPLAPARRRALLQVFLN